MSPAMQHMVEAGAQTVAVSFFIVACVMLLAGFMVGTVVEAIVALTE